jgi:hypothetical protein
VRLVESGAHGAAPGGATVALPVSRWILRPWQDLLLFVGTPAIILPVALVAERASSGKTLYALVMAFGALGHHLPGMMRAYGDRALFARFRSRFIVAPLFLVALCAVFALDDAAMSPIILITYFWGVWHGLMQTHGFLRIYDAKARSFGSLTVRLDQWMCLTWYVAGVLFSTTRLHHILQKFYASGGPAVAPGSVHALQVVWAALTALVTVAFLANLVRTRRAGAPASPVKLLLLATSIGFWWYTNAVVGNMLVGIALFEVFHDVQYLAIVWTYNRRRVETDAHVGAFTRYVFRGRWTLIVLYTAMVFAYGALSLLPKLPSVNLNALFTAVLAASTLLHFYYDSFIWKVKEKPTRTLLGMDGGKEILPAVRGNLYTRAPQALRWAALVVAAAGLGVTHAHPRLTQDEAMRTLGESFPDYPLAQNNLAVFLLNSNDPDGAIRVSRRVLAGRPADPDVHAHARRNLVAGLVGAGLQRIQYHQADAAGPFFREAAAIDPELTRTLTANQTKRPPATS